MAKKNMTIEDLAVLMNKRFDLVEKRFGSVDERLVKLDKKIEDEVGNLAAMTAREFGRVHEKIDKTQKQHENLYKAQLVHDFKMTEMVHRAEHFQLEERVEMLEEKNGIRGK